MKRRTGMRHTLRKQILTAVVLLPALLSGLAAQDLTARTRVKQFNLDKGLAIQGYDPVAYFETGKPVEGQSGLAYTFEGARYLFSTRENRDLFVKNPGAYEPMYGGWCAYAMGNDGSKVKVDPETFKIVDGRLYLFYNFYFNNTLKKWNENEQSLKRKAGTNWNRIVSSATE